MTVTMRHAPPNNTFSPGVNPVMVRTNDIIQPHAYTFKQVIKYMKVQISSLRCLHSLAFIITREDKLTANSFSM